MSSMDAAECDSSYVGYRPRLLTGYRGKGHVKRYTYRVFRPLALGHDLVIETDDRKAALRVFLAHAGAVIRMEMVASEVCVGLAINAPGSPALPEEDL